MERKEKLSKVIEMMDVIAKLDKSFGIDKHNLKQLYIILSKVEDEETFNQTYKAILSNLSMIFDKLDKFNKKVDKIYIDRDEKIEKRKDKLDLSALEKKFNF